MATVNKVDLSLDDIIKLNKKETANQKRGRGQTQGRGRGRKIVQGGGHGRGVASQQSARGGGGKPGGLAKKQWNTRSKGAQQTKKLSVSKIRTRTQQKAQQLRLKARKTLQDKNRNVNKNTSTGTPNQQQQQVSTPQRGRGRGLRGRGRGKGLTTGVGRGRGRVQKTQNKQTTVGGTFTRPGGALKLVRTLKTQHGRGGVARGRGWRGRGQPNVGIAKRVMQQALSEKATEPRRGRGRRGRGRLVSSGQESDSMQLTMTQTQGVDFEPVGVDLAPGFASSPDHYTSKSLDSRFTPKTGQKKVQRIVQQGGRSVQFIS